MADRDLPGLLALYDNKQLLTLATSHLEGCRKDRFEEWITRSLRNNTCPALTYALRLHLPEIEPRWYRNLKTNGRSNDGQRYMRICIEALALYPRGLASVAKTERSQRTAGRFATQSLDEFF